MGCGPSTTCRASCASCGSRDRPALPDEEVPGLLAQTTAGGWNHLVGSCVWMQVPSAEGIEVSLWMGTDCLRSSWVVGGRTVTLGSKPTCTLVVPTLGGRLCIVVDDDALSVPDGWSGSRVCGSTTSALGRRDVIGAGEHVVLRWDDDPRVRVELRRYRPQPLPREPGRPLRRRPDALLAAAAVALWGSIVTATGRDAGASTTNDPVEVEMTPLVEAMFSVEPSGLAGPHRTVDTSEAVERPDPGSVDDPKASRDDDAPDAGARRADAGRARPVEVVAQMRPADHGDPYAGSFSLDDAFAGDEALADRSAGTLTAVLDTSHGTIACELFEDRVPKTVANFVGLARGTRPWLDPDRDVWQNARLYDGTTFHRVVPGFVIQGGDPTGKGQGGPGYTFENEIVQGLRYDRAGRLGMANRGPGTNGSQFFITQGAFEHLDELHTIFGQCDLETVDEIGAVEVNHGPIGRPVEPVTLRRVTIVRR